MGLENRSWLKSPFCTAERKKHTSSCFLDVTAKVQVISDNPMRGRSRMRLIANDLFVLGGRDVINCTDQSDLERKAYCIVNRGIEEAERMGRNISHLSSHSTEVDGTAIQSRRCTCLQATKFESSSVERS